MKLKSAILASSLACALLCVTAHPGRAQILSTFADGNATTPNGYVGSAGLGWSSAYTTAVDANNTLTGNVVNTAPIDGGGNYLSLTHAGTATGNARLARSYNGVGAAGGDINLAGPLHYEFTLRLDNLPASTTGNFIITDRGVGSSSSLSATTTFYIRTNYSTTAPATFAFYNGNGTTTLDTTRYSVSNLPLVAGGTYRFSLDVNPVTLTYVGTVSDGTTSYTSPTLGFGGTTASGGGALVFEDRTAGNISRTFSLDNVSIAPEPSTWACLLAGAVVLAFLRRRAARSV